MTVHEMAERLKKRKEYDLSFDEVIELCFAVIEQHTDKIEQSRAAVILSGIVKKGLGKRTLRFLKKNPKLPGRVHELLNAAFMRMECF